MNLSDSRGKCPASLHYVRNLIARGMQAADVYLKDDWVWLNLSKKPGETRWRNVCRYKAELTR
jgi:hypothetical protein